ncbi:hypothetical protein NEHOM01_0992 [Nematocida homosporus]|uniref:uncharacterized protein n=1 Tax=Nematocida homosporus TaxID=1912981 RepID=UPI002220EA5F|nr:uncharacterized protein NEHOM01_0992 [Nematocida homosporus]KAI5185700.1 hypothetical protein NEHOM01_0992 [Nematocida homosporus]
MGIFKFTTIVGLVLVVLVFGCTDDEDDEDSYRNDMIRRDRASREFVMANQDLFLKRSRLAMHSGSNKRLKSKKRNRLRNRCQLCEMSGKTGKTEESRKRVIRALDCLYDEDLSGALDVIALTKNVLACQEDKEDGLDEQEEIYSMEESIVSYMDRTDVSEYEEHELAVGVWDDSNGFSTIDDDWTDLGDWGCDTNTDTDLDTDDGDVRDEEDDVRDEEDDARDEDVVRDDVAVREDEEDVIVIVKDDDDEVREEEDVAVREEDVVVIVKDEEEDDEVRDDVVRDEEDDDNEEVREEDVVVIVKDDEEDDEVRDEEEDDEKVRDEDDEDEEDEVVKDEEDDEEVKEDDDDEDEDREGKENVQALNQYVQSWFQRTLRYSKEDSEIRCMKVDGEVRQLSIDGELSYLKADSGSLKSYSFKLIELGTNTGWTWFILSIISWKSAILHLDKQNLQCDKDYLDYLECWRHIYVVDVAKMVLQGEAWHNKLAFAILSHVLVKIKPWSTVVFDCGNQITNWSDKYSKVGIKEIGWIQNALSVPFYPRISSWFHSKLRMFLRSDLYAFDHLLLVLTHSSVNSLTQIMYLFRERYLSKLEIRDFLGPELNLDMWDGLVVRPRHFVLQVSLCVKQVRISKLHTTFPGLGSFSFGRSTGLIKGGGEPARHIHIEGLQEIFKCRSDSTGRALMDSISIDYLWLLQCRLLALSNKQVVCIQNLAILDIPSAIEKWIDFDGPILKDWLKMHQDVDFCPNTMSLEAEMKRPWLDVSGKLLWAVTGLFFCINTSDPSALSKSIMAYFGFVRQAEKIRGRHKDGELNLPMVLQAAQPQSCVRQQMDKLACISSSIRHIYLTSAIVWVIPKECSPQYLDIRIDLARSELMWSNLNPIIARGKHRISCKCVGYRHVSIVNSLKGASDLTLLLVCLGILDDLYCCISLQIRNITLKGNDFKEVVDEWAGLPRVRIAIFQLVFDMVHIRVVEAVLKRYIFDSSVAICIWNPIGLTEVKETNLGISKASVGAVDEIYLNVYLNKINYEGVSKYTSSSGSQPARLNSFPSSHTIFLVSPMNFAAYCQGTMPIGKRLSFLDIDIEMFIKDYQTITAKSWKLNAQRQKVQSSVRILIIYFKPNQMLSLIHYQQIIAWALINFSDLNVLSLDSPMLTKSAYMVIRGKNHRLLALNKSTLPRVDIVHAVIIDNDDTMVTQLAIGVFSPAVISLSSYQSATPCLLAISYGLYKKLTELKDANRQKGANRQKKANPSPSTPTPTQPSPLEVLWQQTQVYISNQSDNNTTMALSSLFKCAICGLSYQAKLAPDTKSLELVLIIFPSDLVFCVQCVISAMSLSCHMTQSQTYAVLNRTIRSLPLYNLIVKDNLKSAKTTYNVSADIHHYSWLICDKNDQLWITDPFLPKTECVNALLVE